MIVVVNKMDLAGYSEQRFRDIEREYAEFLVELGLIARVFIPASASRGENVAKRGDETMGWYEGSTLTEALDELEANPTLFERPLRFSVQDVYRFDERRIVAGRVESGKLKVGDKIVFSPSNKSATVATIEAWNSLPREEAIAGDSVDGDAFRRDC